MFIRFIRDHYRGGVFYPLDTEIDVSLQDAAEFFSAQAAVPAGVVPPRNRLPFVLAQSGVPVILLSSGTFADATGAITGLTALPLLPLGVVQVFVFSGAGIPVSQLYYATFSSTTACQLWLDPAGTVKPSGITPGAYAGGTSEVTLASITVPGQILGANGAVRLHANHGYPNNANTKTIINRLNGTVVSSIGEAASLQSARALNIRNRGVPNAQYATDWIGYSTGASNPRFLNIDTSADTVLTLGATLSTSATDFVILYGFSVEILPG